MKVNRIGLALSVLLSASVCLAQNEKNKADNTVKPDLSGTWILDSVKGRVDREIRDYVLTIVHREPDITLIKKYKRGKREISEEITYHTDGKPESAHRLRPNDPLPETRWRGNKLVRVVITRFPVAGLPGLLRADPPEFVNTEEWALSDDKQTLVRTVMATRGPSVLSETRAIFRRSP